jgi:hypothetical protein
MRYKVSTNKYERCVLSAYTNIHCFFRPVLHPICWLFLLQVINLLCHFYALHLSQTLNETAVLCIYETTLISEKMSGRTIIHLYLLVCCEKTCRPKTLLTLYVKSDLYIKFVDRKQRNVKTSNGSLSPTDSALKMRIDSCAYSYVLVTLI